MPLIISINLFWTALKFFKSRVTVKCIVQSRSILRMERGVKIINSANNSVNKIHLRQTGTYFIHITLYVCVLEPNKECFWRTGSY